MTVASSRPTFSSSSSALVSDAAAPKLNGLDVLGKVAAGAAPNVKPLVVGAAGLVAGAAPNENPLEDVDEAAGAAPKEKPVEAAGAAGLEAPKEKPPVEAAAGFAAASAPKVKPLVGGVDDLELSAPNENPFEGGVAGAAGFTAASAPNEKPPADDAAGLAAPNEKPVEAAGAGATGLAKAEAPNEKPVEAALAGVSVSVFFADPNDTGAGFAAAPLVKAGAGARLAPPMGTGLVDANLVAIVPACLR